jgi:RNA polymerase sigma-70 factor (TIGR02943 family)
MTDDRITSATGRSVEEGINFEDEVFLTELRGKMLKFATLQLSDPHIAEDTVQEALIAALKNADSFRRRSALKTWVFAILKNKIADVLRQKTRRSEVSQLSTDVEGDDNLDRLFNSRGFWQADEKPVSWSQPMESVQNEHFWLVFEACLEHLPANQARLFMMREFIQLDTAEICKTLEISTSNLHVMLYRSRLRLRECLENNWFKDGEKS